MTLKIVSDSSSNSRKIDSTVAYATVPLIIMTDEREFVDDETLNVNEMVGYLKQYKGKLCTPNVMFVSLIPYRQVQK